MCKTELLGGLDVSAFALSVLFVVCRSRYLEAAVTAVAEIHSENTSEQSAKKEVPIEFGLVSFRSFFSHPSNYSRVYVVIL